MFMHTEIIFLIVETEEFHIHHSLPVYRVGVWFGAFLQSLFWTRSLKNQLPTQIQHHFIWYISLSRCWFLWSNASNGWQIINPGVVLFWACLAWRRCFCFLMWKMFQKIWLHTTLNTQYMKKDQSSIKPMKNNPRLLNIHISTTVKYMVKDI